MYNLYQEDPEHWAWYMRCPQVEGCTWPPAPAHPGFMYQTAPDHFKHLTINDSNENVYPGPIFPDRPSPDLPGWQTPPMSP